MASRGLCVDAYRAWYLPPARGRYHGHILTDCQLWPQWHECIGDTGLGCAQVPASSYRRKSTINPASLTRGGVSAYLNLAVFRCDPRLAIPPSGRL